MQRVFVGLGSNRGDRHRFLMNAFKALDQIPGWTVQATSSIYETEPVGNKDQPYFLNAVVEVYTSDPADLVLKTLKKTEQSIGRTPSERWGPREIDLDLLYVGGLVHQEPGFVLPHPEISKRRFVLVPLAEIAPDFIDPQRGSSMKELLRNCADVSSVNRTSLSFHPTTLEE